MVDTDGHDPHARTLAHTDGSGRAPDAHGIAEPAVGRFPSSAGGLGSGPLARAVAAPFWEHCSDHPGEHCSG